MSVVVALQDSDVVYMGCDCLTSEGKNKSHIKTEIMYKIVKLKNGMLLGVCGKVLAHQVLIANQEIFNIENKELTKNEIVNSIIPKLNELFSDKRWKESEDPDDNDMPVSLMIAYKSKLYAIKTNYRVISITDWYSTGSGSDYTYSYLANTQLSSRERIINALRTSAKLCASVGSPFVLIDTKNLNYEVVEG